MKMVLGCQDATWLVIVSSITTKIFSLPDIPIQAIISISWISFLSISFEENEALCAIPSNDEIKSVAFSFASSKSLGLDSMSATFYKSNWGIVSKEVIAMVQSFFASSFMLKEMNHTFITLIPKTPNPSTVHNFQ